MLSSGTTEDVSTNKNTFKGRDFLSDQNVLKNQNADFLTTELKKLLKKLNPRMKRHYNDIKSTEAKIAYLEGIKLVREQGELQMSSIFNTLTITITVTVTAKYIKDENSTRIFIVT
ncbi:7062_t:CDS:2, partial [Dentiscutata heterogama]